MLSVSSLLSPVVSIIPPDLKLLSLHQGWLAYCRPRELHKPWGTDGSCLLADLTSLDRLNGAHSGLSCCALLILNLVFLFKIVFLIKKSINHFCNKLRKEIMDRAVQHSE